ncbi:MSMEG_0569 family flavin-dependent oxidoreductase [Hansschlegelia plantiphila]|uniref:FAD-dependent oxidoreductase n=1 Tax=Hansschlegelia plantiphila TaxID=374655 RepID=A0A9W6IX98_9HYPH|nr:MSMEG_0569 family flavin-dependent oxidoreductase [Hansschlegelia plantiphila]GLK66737.1 FAD-dependent oxidoreductase [Hansschlegelia plantiphila]
MDIFPSGLRVPHHPVVIVGGGQAGLSVSAYLSGRGVDHVVFEKHAIAHSWRAQRWDSFRLVTPNWQCRLPGFPYRGGDPYGFMGRDDVAGYVEAFARRVRAPVREGVAVTRIAADAMGWFEVETSEGRVTADAVVLAISGYHERRIPPVAQRLNPSITQIHTSDYKSPDQLPAGAVLVVGSGQSGAQIAEDLHVAGRKVHLAVGSAPRCPRVYRGRDAVEWLDDLGQYDLPIDRHPKGAAVRRQANHYLTGRSGGHEIDLRRFATEGMALHGRLVEAEGGHVTFADDLARNLDAADEVYNGICELIDNHIVEADLKAPPGGRYAPVWAPPAGEGEDRFDLGEAGVTSVVWATGFMADWSFVDAPFLDEDGYPRHRRGVTSVDGLFVIGLPWLHTWGSGRFAGVGRDAEHVADAAVRRLARAGRPLDLAI